MSAIFFFFVELCSRFWLFANSYSDKYVYLVCDFSLTILFHAFTLMLPSVRVDCVCVRWLAMGEETKPCI